MIANVQALRVDADPETLKEVSGSCQPVLVAAENRKIRTEPCEQRCDRKAKSTASPRDHCDLPPKQSGPVDGLYGAQLFVRQSVVLGSLDRHVPRPSLIAQQRAIDLG